VSLWSCPDHRLVGPSPCCRKASLVHGVGLGAQQHVASVMSDDGLIAKLRAENASLRAELDRCRAANAYDAEAHRLAGTLGDENAKLREVLREVLDLAPTWVPTLAQEIALEDRARALLGEKP
jgi:hypothetical protein